MALFYSLCTTFKVLTCICITLGEGLSVGLSGHPRGATKKNILSSSFHSWGKARSEPAYLYVLNGYPKKHSLLLQQAKSLLSWGENVTADSIILTSHEDAILSSEPLLRTSVIPPLKFCSPPSCNHADSDGKLLGATLLANATRHGFRWLLLGDDDTTFFPHDLQKTLQQYDSTKPYFLAMQVDEKKARSEKVLASYKDALANCPALGDADELHLAAYDRSPDVTETSGDCDATGFRDNSWFRWGYGGKGLVLSAGLLDQIPSSTWQKCIDRITSFGGDVRISMCLALLGHNVQLLQGLPNETLSKHKLTEQELSRSSGIDI